MARGMGLAAPFHPTLLLNRRVYWDMKLPSTTDGELMWNLLAFPNINFLLKLHVELLRITLYCWHACGTWPADHVGPQWIDDTYDVDD